MARVLIVLEVSMKAGFLEAKEIEDLIKYLNHEIDASDAGRYYFHFLKEGDMLYGTGDAQACYIRAELVTRKPPKTPNSESIRRAMNEIAIDGKTDFPRVSNYWLEQVQGKASAIAASKTFNVKDDEKKLFWEKFDASKLSIAAQVEKQGGGLTAPKAGQSKQADKRDIIYDNLIRRSCKFLMYDAIEQHRRVAYALDELDLSKVAYLVAGPGQYPLASRARWDDTTKAIVSDIEAKIPVCSSELRELFRYWDYFAKYIVFFKGFWKRNAPWEDPADAPQWALYAQHRAQKLARSHAGKYPGLQERVDRCVQAADPATAIAVYHHEIGPTKILGRGMGVHGVGVEPETKSGDRKGGRGKSNK
jgi:hypothetical protein